MASISPSTAVVGSPGEDLLRAVLVDDEPLARQELAYLLEKSGCIQLIAQGSNGIEAVELIRSLRPEIVFLDVQMPGLDGFAVIKRLLEQKVPLPQVVFATAFDRYAVRAFDVNAIDYLLKPFDRKRVLQTIDKARARVATKSSAAGPELPSEAKLDALMRLMEERVSTQAPRRTTTSRVAGRVVVRAQNRLMLVDQAEICFASIDAGSIQVVSVNIEGHSNARTLEELMGQLDPESFWRVHRSFVVNIRRIREVVPWFKSTYQLRMDDPKRTEIPVSRAQTKRLREMFNL